MRSFDVNGVVCANCINWFQIGESGYGACDATNDKECGMLIVPHSDLDDEYSIDGVFLKRRWDGYCENFIKYEDGKTCSQEPITEKL